MNILLSPAYHERAVFETFRQLGLLHHQPLNSFFWLNMVGGSITLFILSEATKGFRAGSVNKLVTDLN